MKNILAYGDEKSNITTIIAKEIKDVFSDNEKYDVLYLDGLKDEYFDRITPTENYIDIFCVKSQYFENPKKQKVVIFNNCDLSKKEVQSNYKDYMEKHKEIIFIFITKNFKVIHHAISARCYTFDFAEKETSFKNFNKLINSF